VAAARVRPPRPANWGTMKMRAGFRGGSGRGGGGSTAAKTKKLRYHDQNPEEALAPQAWEVENGLGPRVTWRSLLWFYP